MGCGIIPILLCARVPGLSIVGLEVQPELCAMARKSVALNGLEAQIKIVCGDIRNAKSFMDTAVDMVVSNPPV